LFSPFILFFLKKAEAQYILLVNSLLKQALS